MSSLGEIQQYVFFDLDVLPLIPSVKTSSIYILLQTAACMRNIDELRDAADVYEHSLSDQFCCPLTIDIRFTVRLADPANNDAKMKLAEIYEIMGEPRKALDLVYEGM